VLKIKYFIVTYSPVTQSQHWNCHTFDLLLPNTCLCHSFYLHELEKNSNTRRKSSTAEFCVPENGQTNGRNMQ